MVELRGFAGLELFFRVGALPNTPLELLKRCSTNFWS
jgi:hypothetical protein